jgi:methionyl-tRNA formyltransferase
LGEAFDLLRVADPERYPAFFEHRGRTYRIRIDPL